MQQVVKPTVLETSCLADMTAVMLHARRVCWQSTRPPSILQWQCDAGRACTHRKVSCQSSVDQHAHRKYTGPDISRLDPCLQKQWDHAANAQLGNKPYSNKKVWWTCDQCPDGHLHSWSAAVYSRSSGCGCPQCCGQALCKHNSLATKAPLVAAQWDHEANTKTLNDVVAQCKQKFGWHCPECSCKWSASPDSRVSRKMSGCPQCAKKAKTNKRITHPTFAECKHPLLAEWDHERNAAEGNSPANTKLKSGKKVFWLCAKCPAGQEHRWSVQPFHPPGRQQTGCP